jgi:FHS family L-fucose permease-like MFS transporter
MSDFPFFLLSLFILARSHIHETATEPYILYGEPSHRIQVGPLESLMVGAFIGPIIGGALFFGGNDAATGNLDAVMNVYIVIAAVVLLVAFLFYRTPMPEVKEEDLVVDTGKHTGKTLFQHSHFVWAVAAQFFYVAAQVGIAALFINYCTEKNLGITRQDIVLLSAWYYLLSGLPNRHYENPCHLRRFLDCMH